MMKLSAIICSVSITAVVLLGSCKKENGGDVTADDIVGNYLVSDTTSSLNGCDGGPAGDVDFDSYAVVITKKDDNTVTVSAFNHCTGSFDASISGESLVALLNEPCTDVKNVVGTISGNKIYFTYKFYTICEFNCRATAVKQ